MEKIVLRSIQGRLSANYKKRVNIFFEKKLKRKRIIFFFPFALPVIVASSFVQTYLFPLIGYWSYLSLLFSLLLLFIYLFFISYINEKVVKELLKSFFYHYDEYVFYFIDRPSFFCDIKKEELQNIFKEEAEKEIKVLDSLIEEDKKREEEKVETMYNIDKLELMKRELRQSLEKLEK